MYPSPQRSLVAAPVIFADPDYGPLTTIEENGQNSTNRSSIARMLFPPLAASAAEAAAIRPRLEAFTQQSSRIFLGADATESSFKNLHRPQILVLSTHGYFQDAATDSNDGNDNSQPGAAIQNPLLRCGLALADANRRFTNSDSVQDGILTGIEIVGTDLRGTELVVLSACETGLGKVRNGEGVAGLRHAFQLAGAQSVVSSLWSVEDTETARLMTAFFRKPRDRNEAVGSTPPGSGRSHRRATIAPRSRSPILLGQLYNHRRKMISVILLCDLLSYHAHMGKQDWHAVLEFVSGRAIHIVQEHSTSFTRFVGLPDQTGLHMQAGQPASTTRPRINTDRVAVVERQSRLLGRMTAHHDLAGFMWRRKMKRFPVQHEFRLIINRHVRICVGMHKEMPLDLVRGLKTVFQEVPVVIRDVRDLSAVTFEWRIRRKRTAATNIHPRLKGMVVLASVQHHDFVVTAKSNQPSDSVLLNQPVQNSIGIGPTIHIVTQSNQRVVGVDSDKFNKLAQRIEAAMNISNCQMSRQRSPQCDLTVI